MGGYGCRKYPLQLHLEDTKTCGLCLKPILTWFINYHFSYLELWYYVIVNYLEALFLNSLDSQH